MDKVLELVSYVVVNLVDRPEDVRIRCLQRDDAVLLEVHVHPEDQGRMIGKGGQTVNALRTLLDVMSARAGHTYNLEIADTDEAGLETGEDAKVPADADTEAGSA